jgi:hypothetical protein
MQNQHPIGESSPNLVTLVFWEHEIRGEHCYAMATKTLELKSLHSFLG